MNLLLSVISCPARSQILGDTIQSIRGSDWGTEPTIHLDPGHHPDPKVSQTRNARTALEHAHQQRPDWLLFAEDDISVNKFIRRNLTAWLRWCRSPVATLYHQTAEDLVYCERIGGSQAIVIRGDWIGTVLALWDSWHPSLMQDLRIYRTLAKTADPFIPVHVPNLVQHRPAASTWGGPGHQSPTYSADWSI